MPPTLSPPSSPVSITEDDIAAAGYNVALEATDWFVNPTRDKQLLASLVGQLARERHAGHHRPAESWTWPLMRDAAKLCFANWSLICQVARRFAREDAAAGVPR